MKPLNLDNKPCNPVSSNCVIWQGPTLECINLCKGDTVSDAVAALATELCKILDQINVTDYDLSCLGITSCGPTDFKGLIELLIEKICELQDIPAPSETVSGSCPDCVVTVASCFVEDGATTMQLLDYVQMIALKVCTLIDEIGTLSTEVANLDIRVTALENQEKQTFTLPSILVECTLDDGVIVSGNAYKIDEVLNALVNDDIYGYCALLGSTGLPADLLSAVATQCINNADSTLSNKGTSYAAEYLGVWVNSPITVADAITNLWLVVCDIYQYISGISFPVSIVTAGDNITVTSTVVGSTTTYEVSGKNTIITSTDGTVNVTDTVVGETTTYDLSVTELPGFSVQGQPVNLSRVVPSLNSTRLCDGNIQINTNIEYDDFGTAYDPLTGIFTVPEDGIYTISFFQHMSITTGDGWFNSVTPGQLTAGITSSSGCQYYCVNNFTPVVVAKHASINGSFTRFLPAGTDICLKVINTTGQDYISQVGDTSRFSVQRVKF